MQGYIQQHFVRYLTVQLQVAEELFISSHAGQFWASLLQGGFLAAYPSARAQRLAMRLDKQHSCNTTSAPVCRENFCEVAFQNGDAGMRKCSRWDIRMLHMLMKCVHFFAS